MPRPQPTVDASAGQLARIELRKREEEMHRIRNDRQKVKHILERTGFAGAAVLEARLLGYGPDSARLLVKTLEQEIKQEREG